MTNVDIESDDEWENVSLVPHKPYHVQRNTATGDYRYRSHIPGQKPHAHGWQNGTPSDWAPPIVE